VPERGRLRALAALLGLLALLLGATPALAQVPAGDRRAIGEQIDAIVEAIGDGDSDTIVEMLAPGARADLRSGIERQVEGVPTKASLDGVTYEAAGTRVRASGRLTVGQGSAARNGSVYFLFERRDGDWLLFDSDMLLVLPQRSASASLSAATPTVVRLATVAATAAAGSPAGAAAVPSAIAPTPAARPTVTAEATLTPSETRLLVGLAGGALVFALVAGLVALLLTAFWLWMIVDVIGRPMAGKPLWLAVVILAGWIGAIVYYFGVRRSAGASTAVTAPVVPVVPSVVPPAAAPPVDTSPVVSAGPSAAPAPVADHAADLAPLEPAAPAPAPLEPSAPPATAAEPVPSAVAASALVVASSAVEPSGAAAASSLPRAIAVADEVSATEPARVPGVPRGVVLGFTTSDPERDDAPASGPRSYPRRVPIDPRRSS
jgi:hypothetical protein